MEIQKKCSLGDPSDFPQAAQALDKSHPGRDVASCIAGPNSSSTTGRETQAGMIEALLWMRESWPLLMTNMLIWKVCLQPEKQTRAMKLQAPF